MKRKGWRYVVAAIIFWASLGTAESRADLFLNMGFDADLTGWDIGAHDPIGDPTGYWNVQWSPDHGGSAQMYVNGAPAQTSVSQNTQLAIMPGDQITINIHHTDLGNFSGWWVYLKDSVVFRGTQMNEGYESYTWIVDRYFAPSTFMAIGAAVWPGEATYWLDSIVYTPAPVPVPATLLLFGSGLAALGAFRKIRKS